MFLNSLNFTVSRDAVQNTSAVLVSFVLSLKAESRCQTRRLGGWVVTVNSFTARGANLTKPRKLLSSETEGCDHSNETALDEHFQ